MKNVRHNGKTLLMTLLVLGCMALVIMWPQWRDELRAQTSPRQMCMQIITCQDRSASGECPGFSAYCQGEFLEDLRECIDHNASLCPLSQCIFNLGAGGFCSCINC